MLPNRSISCAQFDRVETRLHSRSCDLSPNPSPAIASSGSTAGCCCGSLGLRHLWKPPAPPRQSRSRPRQSPIPGSIGSSASSSASLCCAPRVRALRPSRTFVHRRRNDTSLIRAIIGSAMRRSLRSKNLHGRIKALTQSVDLLVERLLRRLPRGLTRRRPIIALHEASATGLAEICRPSAAPADTS